MYSDAWANSFDRKKKVSEAQKIISDLEKAKEDLESHRYQNEKELGKQKNLIIDKENHILALTEDLAEHQERIADLGRSIETLSQQREKQR